MTPEDFRRRLQNRPTEINAEKAQHEAQVQQTAQNAASLAASEKLLAERELLAQRQRAINSIKEVWTAVPSIRSRLETIASLVGGGDITQQVLEQTENTDEVIIRYQFPFNSRTGREMISIPTGRYSYSPAHGGNADYTPAGSHEIFKYRSSPNQVISDGMGINIRTGPYDFKADSQNTIIHLTMMYLQRQKMGDSELDFYGISQGFIGSPIYYPETGGGFYNVTDTSFNYPDISKPASAYDTDPFEVRLENCFVRLYDKHLEVTGQV